MSFLNRRTASAADTTRMTLDSDAQRYYRDLRQRMHARVDRLLGMLLVLQWIAGIVLALTVSPTTWAGASSSVHVHVYAAFLLGGLIALPPVWLAFRQPGTRASRYAIAVAQGLAGALLIHLTGGRIETHFHVFASLGILAGYHDWRTILIMAGVAAADHLLRGLFFPQSIFGVTTVDLFRVGEHAFWVLFSCYFLVRFSLVSRSEQLRLATALSEADHQSAAAEAAVGEAQAREEALRASEQDLTQAKAEIEARQQQLDADVERMLEQMQRLADGDLSASLPTGRDGAMGRLFDGFNTVVQQLDGMLHESQVALHESAEVTDHIQEATSSLAEGASEQSVQAQEVAAAVVQMSASISSTAADAARTAEIARSNGDLAEQGSQVMREAVATIDQLAEVVQGSSGTINRLGDSSAQIGEIVSVISDIADQTNLLALNAAIEAARAGEQGRGFAVVADEVRKLAERTTQATREIADMIGTIQDDTQQVVDSMSQGTEVASAGQRLAGEAGEALRHIMTGVQDAITVVEQIAAANDQQSATSQQIAQAMDIISTVSSESASRISEIASAVDILHQQANTLRAHHARFQTTARVETSASASTPVPATA